MIWREAGWLVGAGVPILVGSGIAFGIGRQQQGLAGVIAFALCVPTAILTLAATRWFAKRHPLGGLLGMMVGIVVRLIVALGGGLAIFFATGWFEGTPVGFLFWLLAAYLLTLVAETVLLAVPLPAPAIGSRSEGE